MYKIISISIIFILFLGIMIFTFISTIPSKSFTKNPFLLNLILFFLILLISLNMSMFFSSYWFSFIIFLIMIGGLMILFLYFTSICPNEFMFISLLNLTFFFLKWLYFNSLMMFFITYFDIFSLLPIKYFNEITKLNLILDLKFLMNFKSFNLNYMFMMPMIKISLFVIFYLLFTLIIVSKLCKNTNKPLRQLKK